MTGLAKLETKMDKRFDELFALLSQFASDVQAKFDEHDARFERIEKRFDRIDKRFGHLITTVDGLAARIDRYEAGQVAQDHKIARLERWTKLP